MQYNEKDLEWYCEQKIIMVDLYSILSSCYSNKQKENLRFLTQLKDLHKTPDEKGKHAFHNGWLDAVNAKLYKSIHNKKTYQNAGNIFVWIYRDQFKEFQSEAWNRYIENSMRDN